MEAASTASLAAKIQLITNSTLYKVPNGTLKITQSVLSARVHRVVLKGTLSIKLDTHMRGYPGEVNQGTSPLQGVDEIKTLIDYITVCGKVDCRADRAA